MQKRLDIGHVYMITNTANNKKYIGQTWYDLSDRWTKHKSKNKRGCPYLSRAIQKYGAEEFTMESIARFTDQETADLLETYYIEFYCTTDPEKGYNLTSGGQGNRGPMPEATRQKISQSRMGITFSPETLLKMSLAHKDTILSDDSQKKLDASRARKRKLTMEQAKQIRQKWKDGQSQKKLAQQYNVSILVIHLIVHNKTYINDYT